MTGAALVVLADVATAASGCFNAGYFARYWLRARETRAKRIGAFALVLAGLAAVVEALFSQGMFWSYDELASLGGASVGIWVVVRVPLLAATLFISGIVLRRVFS